MVTRNNITQFFRYRCTAIRRGNHRSHRELMHFQRQLMRWKRRSNKFLRKEGGNINACLNNKRGSRNPARRNAQFKTCSIIRQKKRKTGSQTFPTPKIFVLLHFVIYEDTCIKKAKMKKIQKVVVFKFKLFV